MAERSPISLRETAGIEGGATLRATKTRFVPRLANSFHLNYYYFQFPTGCELKCDEVKDHLWVFSPALQNIRSCCNVGTAVFQHPTGAPGYQSGWNVIHP